MSAFRRIGAGLLGAALIALVAGAEEVRVFPGEVDLALCKELAVQFNPAIQREQERIREQEGVLIETDARRIPQGALTGTYNVTDPDRVESFTQGGAFNDQSWRVGVEVTYRVFGGGRLVPASRAAEAAVRAAQAALSAVVNDVLLEVDRAYYGALLAKQQIRVQEEAVTLFDRQLELARNRYAAGQRPRFDVLQAEVAMENAKPPLIRARNAYRIAVDDLRRLVGLPFREGLEPESIDLAEAWPFPEVGVDVDQAVERALEARPELAALAARREAGEQQILVARRTNRPDLDLYGNYGAQSLTLENDLDEYLHGWEVGLRATWPFFDGGETRGRRIQAASQLEQTRITTDAERLDIEGETRRAFFDYEVAEEILRSAARTIEQAEEALRLANNRYEAGGATQLDVLRAQLEVTRARLVKVEADFDYHVAVSRLHRAMGLTP